MDCSVPECDFRVIVITMKYGFSRERAFECPTHTFRAPTWKLRNRSCGTPETKGDYLVHYLLELQRKDPAQRRRVQRTHPHPDRTRLMPHHQQRLSHHRHPSMGRRRQRSTHRRNNRQRPSARRGETLLQRNQRHRTSRPQRSRVQLQTRLDRQRNRERRRKDQDHPRTRRQRTRRVHPVAVLRLELTTN